MKDWLTIHKINLNIRAEQLDYQILFKMYEDLIGSKN